MSSLNPEGPRHIIRPSAGESGNTGKPNLSPHHGGNLLPNVLPEEPKIKVWRADGSPADADPRIDVYLPKKRTMDPESPPREA